MIALNIPSAFDLQISCPQRLDTEMILQHFILDYPHRVWIIVAKFFQELAENYHLREWAITRPVEVHDSFSAGYYHKISHRNTFFGFNHRKCHHAEPGFGTSVFGPSYQTVF